MRTLRRTVVWFCMLVASFPSAGVLAQTGGDITGTVTDDAGGVIAGVKVTLLDAAGVTRGEAATNSAGTFRIPGVARGSFSLRFEQKNFETNTTPLAVTEAAPPELHIVLRVSGIRQELTVSETGPYVTPEASSATKIETPVMETPVSIHVVPQAVLLDQQVVRLETAIQNISGVIQSNDGYGTANSFVIRGFDQNELTYEDGLRVDQSTNSGLPTDMVHIEDVEVVKGPESVLYGQAEPGGLVNVVTKKPQDAPAFNLQQQFGNYAFYRTTAGATGPIVKRRLLYRVDFDYTNSGSFRNFIHSDRTAVYPSLSFRPTHRDEYTVQGYYGRGTLTSDNGIPFLPNGTPANVPLSRNYADPGSNGSPSREYYVKLLGSHSFSEKWRVRLAYKSNYITGPVHGFEVYLDDTDASGNLNRIGLASNYFHHWTHQVVTDATGQFSTWGLQHNVIAGFDYYNNYGGYEANIYNLAPINIYTPVYNQPFTPPDPAGNTIVVNGQTSYGAYVQDQVNLGKQVHLLASLRFNRVQQYDNGFPQAGDVRDRPKPTPRVGLLWQPVSHLGLYSSFTDNYGATALGALTANGKALPPQSARQYEAGVKAQWLNKRLVVSGAIYQITKHNVPAADPQNPLLSIAIGEARSRGVEVDVTGQITPGLKVIGGYSHIDAKTLQDTNLPSLAGLRFPGVPYDSGSVWGVYEIQHEKWKGLRFGAGVLARSGELAWESPDGMTYLADRIPGFGIVDAMAAYGWQAKRARVTLQVNANNLLNKGYFVAVTPSQALPGAPFSLMPALKVQF